MIGRCIYRSDSARVYQNLFYRWLMFRNNTWQTVLNRRNPEIPGLSYLTQLTIAARLNPGDCCLLGLGGGGVLHMLASMMHDKHMVAIEHSSEVIRLAKKYFKVGTIANLEIIEQDAAKFITTTPHRYQNVLADLFCEDEFPAWCNTDEFFVACRKILLPGGTFAVNIATESQRWNIFQHVRTAFDAKTIVMPVKDANNLIVLGCNDVSVMPFLQMIKQNWRLKKMLWDEKWGCMAYM